MIALLAGLAAGFAVKRYCERRRNPKGADSARRRSKHAPAFLRLRARFKVRVIVSPATGTVNEAPAGTV
jgi:hypothetical protein